MVKCNKYARLEQLSQHFVYDETTETYTYNDQKVQIYSVVKSDKKTQYMIGLKTMS